MPNFREQLLTNVSGLCQQLYQKRLALVQQQQLVSEKSKDDVQLLIVQLNNLRTLHPFPAETDVDMAPLDKLRADIDAADGDHTAIEEELMDWVRNVRSAGPPRVAASAEANQEETSPINQRMIDDLSLFRATIDKTRLRLLREHDQYDREAYTSARNAWTLARSVYEQRLRLNQITATNEQAAKMEQELIPAADTATGATFPASIQAGADFMSEWIFA